MNDSTPGPQLRPSDWPCRPLLACTGLLAVALGTAPGSMDSAVNVAFPALTAAFDMTLEDIRWIVIPWVVAQVALTLQFGRLGDRYGHKRMFVAGMSAASLALTGCAIASDLGSLALMRFLQGVAVGLGVACAPALATFLFPARLQRTVLAVYVTAFGLGAALGPLLAGPMLSAWGWPAVFWFRVPIALAALLLIAWIPVAPRARQSGLAPAAATRNRTWLPDAFRNPAFIGLQCLWVAANLAVFSIMLLGPYLLGARSALSVERLGVLLALYPAGSVVAGLFGSLVSRRMRAFTLVQAGLAVASASIVAVGLAAGLQADAGFAIAFFAAGIGIGTLQIGYMDLTLTLLPDSARGLAGGLVNVTRLLGVAGGAILLVMLHRMVAIDAAPIAGFGKTFAITGVALALVSLCSIPIREALGRKA